jgi:hypothetical protein
LIDWPVRGPRHAEFGISPKTGYKISARYKG